MAGIVGALRQSDDSSSEQQVTRTSAGWEPSTLTVERGDTVTFVNESGDDAWPASDVHPTHERYPGFDAERGLGSGSSWSYTFERPGRWAYHDHLSPEKKGVIVVR